MTRTRRLLGHAFMAALADAAGYELWRELYIARLVIALGGVVA
jgi:hypothetical protein